MNDLNHVFLKGRLTRDVSGDGCRLRQDGLSVVIFSVAVNSYKRNGEKWNAAVSYFDVKAFGKLADSLRGSLHKGLPVVIEGKLRQERWQSQDGSAKSAVRVYADRVEFLARAAKEAEPVQAASVQDQVVYEEFFDDLPC